MSLSRAANAALSIALVVSACDNSLGPESVRSVEITIDRTTLFEGEEASISTTAIDIDGGSISSSEVTWISRDPTTARVERGALSAIAPGVTTVVADVRGARDSIRIRVRFSNLDQGEIGVRLQGQNGVRQATEGETYIHRFIPLENRPSFLPPQSTIRTPLSGEPDLTPSSPSAALYSSADTLIWISFQGLPTESARHLDGYKVIESEHGLAFQGPDGALLQAHRFDLPQRTELFLPVDGVDLVFDEVDLPQEDGAIGGKLRGAVAFEAAGVIVTVDQSTNQPTVSGPVGDSTLSVYVEFETNVVDWIIGMAEVGVTQDNLSVDQLSNGQAMLLGGSVDFLLSIGIGQSMGSLPVEVATIRTHGLFSGPGTFDIGSITPVDFTTSDPTRDPDVPAGPWAALAMREIISDANSEPPLQTTGYSTSGTITVTEYRAPTDDRFGMITGSYRISFTLFGADGVPTGGTLDATAEFALPIVPPCLFARTCP